MKRIFAMALLVSGLAAEDDDYATIGRAGWGAFSIPVPLAVQAERGLVPGQGVLVLGVRPGGTADSLGVQPGDVVLELNGQSVASRRDVRAVVRAAAPGEAVQVAVIAPDGDAQTLKGTFKERPPMPPFPPGWGPGPLPGGQPPGAGPGPLPGFMEAPETIAARQTEELLSEARQLAEARAELESVRAQLASVPDPAWYLAVDIRLEKTP